MRHAIVTLIFLLAWFLIVAPVTFSQTILLPLGDALVNPDTGTVILPFQSPQSNMGVILNDQGVEPYMVLPKTTVQPYDPTPLPTYEPPRYEPPTYLEPVPSSWVYGSEGLGGYGY